MRTDAITKTLLALIALGLFLNVITNAYADKSDIRYCMDKAKIRGYVDKDGNIEAKIYTYC